MIFPARNLHGRCGDVPIIIFDDTRGYSIRYPIQYPTINLSMNNSSPVLTTNFHVLATFKSHGYNMLQPRFPHFVVRDFSHDQVSQAQRVQRVQRVVQRVGRHGQSVEPKSQGSWMGGEKHGGWMGGTMKSHAAWWFQT